MAIPNPNPNIRDYEKTDNFTWSSNKIDEAFTEGASTLIDDSASSDSTTYSSNKIESMISGGSTYNETILFTGDGSIPSASFTLNSKYDEYDAIIFNFVRNDAVFAAAPVNTSFIDSRISIMGNCELIFFGYDDEYSNFQIASDKKTINPGVSSMGSCGIYNIIGIKF